MQVCLVGGRLKCFSHLPEISRGALAGNGVRSIAGVPSCGLLPCCATTFTPRQQKFRIVGKKKKKKNQKTLPAKQNSPVTMVSPGLIKYLVYELYKLVIARELAEETGPQVVWEAGCS